MGNKIIIKRAFLLICFVYFIYVEVDFATCTPVDASWDFHPDGGTKVNFLPFLSQFYICRYQLCLLVFTVQNNNLVSNLPSILLLELENFYDCFETNDKRKEI